MGQIVRRAFKEALKLVRVETVEAGVILLVGQGVLAVLLWSFQRDANLWSRAGTAALPFLLFPAAFIWKLATIPGQMLREKDASIAALSGSKDKRDGDAWSLTQHLNSGLELFHRQVLTEEEFAAWREDDLKWRQEVFQAITLVFSPATAQSLEHVFGLMAVHVTGSFNLGHSNLRQNLSERMKRLQSRIDSLTAG